MPFILRRTDQWRGFVAKPGSKKSYVPFAKHARQFATREEADANRCKGNEVVMEYHPQTLRRV
jgi:hypothetical protein